MTDSPWMLGNWSGTRSELANAGYDFTLKYVGELGSNLSGAYDRTPGNAEPSNGFKPFISGSQGTTFPFEVIWKGRLNDLAAEYHAGYYYGKLDTQETYKDA
ncbi:carbohydrate porin [Pseudomonas tohonis]|uniref:carbohydrate porin n=1 Tax=Pseudomonas tohonis TaxID=2725477 RepID=UPI001F232D16|nr:carbohydrate porin [Pseudomonas tohonis]